MTESELYKVLGEQGFGSADIIDFDDEGCDILIEWGDWKHDHICLQYVMQEYGYNQVDERVTQEDGSDCYSSVHSFTYNKV